jgi:hypothetical protein
MLKAITNFVVERRRLVRQRRRQVVGSRGPSADSAAGNRDPRAPRNTRAKENTVSAHVLPFRRSRGPLVHDLGAAVITTAAGGDRAKHASTQAPPASVVSSRLGFGEQGRAQPTPQPLLADTYRWFLLVSSEPG